MPKRTDIKSVLIIGAGPIIIGQACEFDYSGAQACKALREEGYRVILVNSNPATIMTDPQTADVTYIEPITWEVVERIIAKERPDAILPTMGGQTALNCAMDLARHGVLDKYDIELIGAKPDAIDKAEDRELFKETMAAIQLEGERFDLDERIAAELFGLSTPKPKNLSRKKMDECRERYDHGKLSVPLSLPEKRKQEETEIDNEADYSTVGEYTKALSNITLDELALDRF
mgnify:CR=1 FL=1